MGIILGIVFGIIVVSFGLILLPVIVTFNFLSIWVTFLSRKIKRINKNINRTMLLRNLAGCALLSSGMFFTWMLSLPILESYHLTNWYPDWIPHTRSWFYFFEYHEEYNTLWYFVVIFHPSMLAFSGLLFLIIFKSNKILNFYYGKIQPGEAKEWFYLKKDDFVKYFIENRKYKYGPSASFQSKAKTDNQKMGKKAEDTHENYLKRSNIVYKKEVVLENDNISGRADFIDMANNVVHEVKSTRSSIEVIKNQKIEKYKAQIKTYLFLNNSKKGELIIFREKEESKNLVNFYKRISVSFSPMDINNIQSKNNLINEIKENAADLKSIKRALEIAKISKETIDSIKF